MAESSIGQLQIGELQTLGTDPPIDKAATSLDEVRKAVAWVRGVKAPGVCSICWQLLKGEGGLDVVLSAVWHSGAIPPD